MKTQIILLIIFGVLLSSCKKEHKITIQAQNLITGDGSDYANMPFVVLQSRPAWNKDKVKRVYEGTLDQNGQASFFLKMNRNWSYTLNIEHPENLCYGGDLVEFLDNDSNNDVVVDYSFCAYSKLIINNINCQGPADSLILYRGNQAGTFQPFAWVHEGCTYWETNGYSEIPMGEQYYEWTVIRSGVSTTYYDTIFINKGDSIIYELNY